MRLAESLEAKVAEVTTLTWAAEAAKRDTEDLRSELFDKSERILELEARPVYGDTEVQSFLERFRTGAELVSDCGFSLVLHPNRIYRAPWRPLLQRKQSNWPAI